MEHPIKVTDPLPICPTWLDRGVNSLLQPSLLLRILRVIFPLRINRISYLVRMLLLFVIGFTIILPLLFISAQSSKHHPMLALVCGGLFGLLTLYLLLGVMLPRAYDCRLNYLVIPLVLLPFLGPLCFHNLFIREFFEMLMIVGIICLYRLPSRGEVCDPW
jgi:uncharacterized membrane protein YhaH (DUF805 family)